MDMVSILDLIAVGAGAYLVYAWVLMKTKGEIKKEVLMYNDINLKKCKDLDGYRAFIAPRVLFLGVVFVIYGGAGLVNTYLLDVPTMVYLVIMVFSVATLIWYVAQSRKGIEKFW